MSKEHLTPMDPEAIKQAIDLVDFAQRYTQLRQISRAGEFAGPCPRCGGEDRFHVKGRRFYCRQCYPRGGDVIDLVQMLHQLNFREACQWLTHDAGFISERPTVPPAPISGSEHPPIADFHASAYKTMLATSRRLFTAAGAPGRAYLQDRGLGIATWRHFHLGVGDYFHPVRRRNEAALFIPWLSHDGQQIDAMRLRFIDPTVTKAERYALRAGSHPRVFGLHRLHPAADLVLVEGEFNCMALHQQGIMALSLGSETGARQRTSLAILTALLPAYAYVHVWLDDPARAEQLLAQLTAGPFRKKAGRVLTAPQDANDLLAAGQLAGFLQHHHLAGA